eukprot:Rhum_TRINITY_DN7508_c0_g1::Rhum_TRINITY_DN7508_c0_g1_i1::g.23403::m.23403
MLLRTTDTRSCTVAQREKGGRGCSASLRRGGGAERYQRSRAVFDGCSLRRLFGRGSRVGGVRFASEPQLRVHIHKALDVLDVDVLLAHRARLVLLDKLRERLVQRRELAARAARPFLQKHVLTCGNAVRDVRLAPRAVQHRHRHRRIAEGAGANVLWGVVQVGLRKLLAALVFLRVVAWFAHNGVHLLPVLLGDLLAVCGDQLLRKLEGRLVELRLVALRHTRRQNGYNVLRELRNVLAHPHKHARCQLVVLQGLHQRTGDEVRVQQHEIPAQLCGDGDAMLLELLESLEQQAVCDAVVAHALLAAGNDDGHAAALVVLAQGHVQAE